MPVVLLSTGRNVKPNAMCPTDWNKLWPSCVSLVKMRQWKQYTCQFQFTSHQMIQKLHSFHMCTDMEYCTALLQSSQDQFTDKWVYQHVYSAILKYATCSSFLFFFKAHTTFNTLIFFEHLNVQIHSVNVKCINIKSIFQAKLWT